MMSSGHKRYRCDTGGPPHEFHAKRLQLESAFQPASFTASFFTPPTQCFDTHDDDEMGGLGLPDVHSVDICYGAVRVKPSVPQRLY